MFVIFCITLLNSHWLVSRPNLLQVLRVSELHCIGNGAWDFINILYMSHDIVVEYIIYEYLFCVCAAYDGQFFFINSWKCIYCTKRILILEKNKLSETLISMSQTFEIGSWQGQKLSFILDRLWSLHAHKGSYINHVNSWGGGGFSQMTSL